MKYFVLPLLFILCSSPVFAQNPAKYSRVEINLEGKDIHVLTRLGIETDHGLHAPGHSLVTEISDLELKMVQDAGFQTKIQIDDLKKDYLERLQNPSASPRDESCGESSVTPYPTPANYTYGSMGGYHTLSEMMAVLDDMRAKYPNLITARADASDTISTWEGRKIQYVKISKNPDLEENEPEVLYTALHHSREPNGASQMLFFMWHLLENYDTDPEVRYILDHSELYFVPCINPDGYVFNETTDPQGGGFWRKNRRVNSNGSFGVDLNRNYGYFWGNDNNGSSPNPSSDTYRGPAAFSEPETRTMRDFALAHDFVFAQNYHTFSNLLIYPWAYNNLLADTSLAIFGELFTRENNYKAGTAIETVGYNVNGNSDDWFYAVAGANSFTPEVGTTGFWPMPSEIDDLNRENVWQNLSTALCALRFGEIQDKSPQYFSTLTPEIEVALTRYGYQDGAFLIGLTPLTANIVSVGPTSQLVELEQFETKTLRFDVGLQPNIQLGEVFSFLLTYSNGTYEKTDTLHNYFGGVLTEAFFENGNNISDWNGSWGVTQSTFYSAPLSITDSPVGDYETNVYSDLQLSNPITIPAGSVSPRVYFWAKWEIESRYDYVQLRASSISNNMALCGRYTKPGSGMGAQPENEPVFEGFQEEWVEESMDLSDFIGQNIQLQFILGSDNLEEGDGFYFDDLRVEYTDPTLLNTVRIPLKDFQLRQSEPNPANEFALIRWENNKQYSGDANLLVFNVLGQNFANQSVQLSTQSEVKIDTRTWPAGLYTYLLQTPQGQSQAMKMTVVR